MVWVVYLFREGLEKGNRHVQLHSGPTQEMSGLTNSPLDNQKCSDTTTISTTNNENFVNELVIVVGVERQKRNHDDDDSAWFGSLGSPALGCCLRFLSSYTRVVAPLGSNYSTKKTRNMWGEILP